MKRSTNVFSLAVLGVVWFLAAWYQFTSVSPHNPARYVQDHTITDLRGQITSSGMRVGGKSVYDNLTFPDGTRNHAPYPLWAHGHFLHVHWLHCNPSDVERLIDAYQQKHGIVVDAVILDITWHDAYKSFTFNRRLFPDPALFVSLLQGKGVRVLLWASGLLSVLDDRYTVGKERGYYIHRGSVDDPHVFAWTHADFNTIEGSLIDFSNPEAVEWFLEPTKELFDMGVSGFRLAGVDALLLREHRTAGAAGHMSKEDYARYYYHTVFDYGRHHRGWSNFLIVARPVDSFGSFAYQEFSPPDISFAQWVGDHPFSFVGLRESMMNVFNSVQRGHINPGMLIGGSLNLNERDEDKGPRRETELFLRWTQAAALMPFMCNGGSRHTPWAYGPLVANIYKSYVDIHRSLAVYFSLHGTRAFHVHRGQSGVAINEEGSRNASSMRLLDPERITFAYPETWAFLIGDSLMAVPVVWSFGRHTTVDIPFPSGVEWTSWYDPNKVFTEPLVGVRVSRGTLPLFRRRGAIMPLAAPRRLQLVLSVDTPRLGQDEAIGLPQTDRYAAINASYSYEAPRHNATQRVFGISYSIAATGVAAGALETDTTVKFQLRTSDLTNIDLSCTCDDVPVEITMDNGEAGDDAALRSRRAPACVFQATKRQGGVQTLWVAPPAQAEGRCEVRWSV